MISVNDSLAVIAELRASLAADNLSTIDLDRLASVLADLSTFCEKAIAAETDLQLFRDDCITRITGLAKAIAAARPTPDACSQAVDFIDALPSFTAPQLLDTFRRISARFRDTFPASYGRPLDRLGK